MLHSSILVFFFLLLSPTAGFSTVAIRPGEAITKDHKVVNSKHALFVSMAYSGGTVGGGAVVGAGGAGGHGPSLELLDLFNHQVTHELESSQLYLSASIWFDNHGFEGMAAYMLVESTKEREHALQLIDFANKRHFPIKLETLVAPNSDWDDPEQVWQDVLKLEHENTNNLLLLAEAANKCHDFSVLAFLNPFHIEQVDSEDAIATIIAKVHDETRTPGLLRQLDHELGLEAVAGGVVH
jgi:ferritin